MNIIYLKELQNTPSIEINNSGRFSVINGVSESEISQLEQNWNSGINFPLALKELLYLAGERCYVLDYGWNDSQEELQAEVRDQLIEWNRFISRPFYAIDVYGADQFLFVYLDEGDNPNVYEAYLPPLKYDDATTWLSNLDRSLKDFINFRINKIKKGYNPF
jgi:hypothetical protein